MHLLLLLTVFGIAESHVQPEADSDAIRQVALDYIEGGTPAMPREWSERCTLILRSD
jgi:hypothetical protein